MNRRLSSLFLAACSIVLLISFTSISAFATEGNSVGNAGGDTAADFTETARKAVRILKSMPLGPTDRLYVLKIERAIRRTHVGSRKTVWLNGLEVDAVNKPKQNRIIISRTGWGRLIKKPYRNRVRLALHEYAMVAELNDHRYAVTDALLLILSSGGQLDQWRDETNKENVLARFGEIRTALMLADVRDGREICRVSGLLAGARYLFDTLQLVTPWALVQDNQAVGNQLDESITKFKHACDRSTSNPMPVSELEDLIRAAKQPLDELLY